MALAHASRADGYTEFYLSNLWSWTPTGVRRVYEYLDNLNLVRCSPSFLFFELPFPSMVALMQ